MKFSKLWIPSIVVVLVVAGGAYMLLGNKKPVVTEHVATESSSPIASPAESMSPSPSPSASTSQYSSAVKAKVRSEFITACNVQGHYTIAECNCAADYLAKNYSESELAKIYVEYHATKKISSQLEAAAKACGVK